MKAQVLNIINTIQRDEVDAGRLQEVYDISVELGKKLNLPDAFEAESRPDMVKLAVASSRANRRQAYGSRAHGGKRRPMSGMKHSVECGARAVVYLVSCDAQDSAVVPKTRTHWVVAELTDQRSRKIGPANSTKKNAKPLVTQLLQQRYLWKPYLLGVTDLTKM